MSKKQRLQDGAKMSKDINNADLVHCLLQANEQDFVSGLQDAACSQDDLNALSKQLQQISSWVAKYQIQLQREERLRRKSQREEKLQAIYHHSSSDVTSTTKDNNDPYFTVESATVLLDSGFLTSGEIGKLCLLTGKFFFLNLQLDQDWVWKRIFEAKFNYQLDYGLSALYASPRFKQILEVKGYEWVYRHFYPTNEAENKHGANVPDFGNCEPPPSVLNCQNVFFVTLFESPDEYGKLRTIHADVLDNDRQIQKLMTGCDLDGHPKGRDEEFRSVGKNRFRFSTPSAAFERINGPFKDQVLCKHDGERRDRFDRELSKKYNAEPKAFHPTMKTLRSDRRLEFMTRPVISVLALRMDTIECTVLYWTDELVDYGVGDMKDFICESPISLNSIGVQFVKQLFDEENYLDYMEEEDEWEGGLFQLSFIVTMDRKSNVIEHSFYSQLGGGDYDRDTFMNIFRLLDYGMNWERFQPQGPWDFA